MDTITEVRTPRVDWPPVAETMLERMPLADQRVIRDPVIQTISHFDPRRLTSIALTQDGGKPFHFPPAANRPLVFMEQEAEDHFRVIDVPRAGQLNIWHGKPDAGVVDPKSPDTRS